jgi:putative ABC transport system permease protein
MNFSATLRIALLALRINKMRSALDHARHHHRRGCGDCHDRRRQWRTGACRSAQIKSLGSNIIMVLSGSMTSGGARGGSGSQPTIFEEDAYRHDARSR